jgi:RHS repeat-associated protein
LVSNTGQYLYDANANMTYDPSKKITVSYNPLNLPSLVEFDNNDFIEYTYTATGTKLRKTVSSWKTTTGGTIDYAGQFLYQDNELSCIFTPVGRIVPMQYNNETFWKHEYNLKDHLGNTRIVFAAHPHGQPEVMQQTSYFPFGMTLQQQNFGGSLNQPNKLLYNGKELQDDELAGVSLDWYDYGARFYDPQLGRWHVLDPLAADYDNLSPYGYCAGNPIKYIDVNGEFIGTIIGTVVGGVAGAYDSYKKGGDVWAGAAEGAVSGAIAGATVDLAVAATVATGGGALVVIGAGAAAGAIGGAAGAVAGDATGQVVTSVNKGSSISNAVSNINTTNMADKAKTGAVTGAIGGAAGGAVGKGLQAASNSTKAVQGTMSKNITETAKTLTKMGADEKTVGTAVNKITTGMGEAGRNTVNTTNKVAAGTGMATESAIKVGQMQKEEKR